MRVRGQYGSFQVSSINKNAPLIFIVGGTTIPKKGNVPPNWYSGDKLPSRQGYMWFWNNAGYDRLTDFNIYCTYDQYNSALGWAECVGFMKKYGISPSKYILSTFSAGATTSHFPTGVLKVTDPKDWDMIILAGAYIKGTWYHYLNDFIDTINKAGAEKVHYFTINSAVDESEGALPSAKQKLRDNLPWQNVHVNRGNHSDQIKFTSDFIAKNYTIQKTNNALNPSNLSFDNIEPLKLNNKVKQTSGKNTDTENVIDVKPKKKCKAWR